MKNYKNTEYDIRISNYNKLWFLTKSKAEAKLIAFGYKQPSEIELKE